MTDQLAGIFARLDETRASLRVAVDAVPPAHRSTRPAADAWSAAEILEHLSLVERRYVVMLGDRVEAARQSGANGQPGVRADAAAALPDTVVAMLADRSTRRPAPDVVVPSGRLEVEEAWTALDIVRGDLRALIAGLGAVAPQAIVADHHRYGALDLAQWVAFLGAHEQRHVAQMREVASHFGTARPAGQSVG